MSFWVTANGGKTKQTARLRGNLIDQYLFVCKPNLKKDIEVDIFYLKRDIQSKYFEIRSVSICAQFEDEN